MPHYSNTSHWTDIAYGELVDNSEFSLFSAADDSQLSRTKYLGVIIGLISLLAFSCVFSFSIICLMVQGVIALL